MQERSDIRESQPPLALHEDAAHTIQWAANVYQSEVARLAKQAGLSLPQYCVLRILGGASDALSCSQISERMVTRDPDITRLIDKLVKQGYVSRERCNEDRRVVQSCITDRGLELMQQVDSGVSTLHRNLFGQLDRGEIEALTHTLRKLQQPGDSA